MRFFILLIVFGLIGCNYSIKKESMEKPISTLINTIEANPECGIFEILNSDNDNPLEWEIKPTTLQLIPNGQGHYLTKAYRIEKNGVYKFAYVDVNTPERIIDYVIYDLKKPSYSYAYDSINIEVIPAVASDCFGSYEVYYSRNNPDLSIEVLEQGLKLSKEKNVIAQDLGYILSDEDRLKEALKYFLISEENGVSSEYILEEIERIYRNLGRNEKADEYKLKVDEIKTAGNKELR